MTERGIVEFVDVYKSYSGEGFAVENLNLSVQRGEFLTLLGPSGSGKTTSLMLLAGFEKVTSGDIVLDGHTIAATPPHKRNIGVVFQHYALFPHMTVAQNIAFPLRARRVNSSEVEKRVERALDMVELPTFGDRRPAQLSGGQQQRVAVARALVFEPRLILMDEPLGALDKRLREQMQEEIKSLQRRLGITMVYVTHDQSEALTMSDRIAVFNHGRVLQLASPEELYARPETPFVASFVGENNSLQGLVTAQNDGHCVDITLGGGTTIRCDAGRNLPVGQDAILSLRPESIILAPGDDIENRMSARVSNVTFLGDHVRLGLEVGDKAAGLSLVQRLAAVPGAAIPRTGETVDIGWRRQDCLAFAVEAG